MISNADLAPCPFCGGAAEKIDIEEDGPNFGGSCICCQACGASSPVHFDRKENLHDSWNRRALSAALEYIAKEGE
jgi:Lar family restriction alleviation protein